MTDDLISRQAAIDALWKALYKYEDKTEKQFNESEELDVADWIQHRSFVQNMSDIDRQTILALPSAQPQYIARDIATIIENEKDMRVVLKQPRWIPCSARLPQARRSVILSTKNWSGEGCYWETTEHHVIWKGYKWNATYWDDEVIAWMPLPEPYKGEES